jgi:REP element-mobilizing transposase RayT
MSNKVPLCHIQRINRFRVGENLPRTIKSITASKIFERFPEVKEKLWGGEFWSNGYYVATVGKESNEHVILNYEKKQGKQNEYKKMYSKIPRLF